MLKSSVAIKQSLHSCASQKRHLCCKHSQVLSTKALKKPSSNTCHFPPQLQHCQEVRNGCYNTHSSWPCLLLNKSSGNVVPIAAITEPCWAAGQCMSEILNPKA